MPSLSTEFTKSLSIYVKLPLSLSEPAAISQKSAEMINLKIKKSPAKSLLASYVMCDVAILDVIRKRCKLSSMYKLCMHAS